ncbi:MAG: hypothetical protein R3290_12660 [Acidimicrobiia bacterium]|nr:hypothetical protein [Acidimicrobiia bacterium]
MRRIVLTLVAVTLVAAACTEGESTPSTSTLPPREAATTRGALDFLNQAGTVFSNAAGTFEGFVNDTTTAVVQGGTDVVAALDSAGNAIVTSFQQLGTSVESGARDVEAQMNSFAGDADAYGRDLYRQAGDLIASVGTGPAADEALDRKAAEVFAQMESGLMGFLDAIGRAGERMIAGDQVDVVLREELLPLLRPTRAITPWWGPQPFQSMTIQWVLSLDALGIAAGEGDFGSGWNFSTLDAGRPRDCQVIGLAAAFDPREAHKAFRDPPTNWKQVLGGFTGAGFGFWVDKAQALAGHSVAYVVGGTAPTPFPGGVGAGVLFALFFNPAGHTFQGIVISPGLSSSTGFVKAAGYAHTLTTCPPDF